MSSRGLYLSWCFIKKGRLFIAAILFSLLLFGPIGSSLAFAPTITAQNAANNAIITRSPAETYYLSAVNELRRSYNLKPLLIDSRLSQSATQKAEDMINKNYWGHYPTNNQSFADFIWSTSPDAEIVGENLAKCYESHGAAFEALINSPTHLANMLGEYTDFGVVEMNNPNDDCVHVVMHFAYYN